MNYLLSLIAALFCCACSPKSIPVDNYNTAKTLSSTSFLDYRSELNVIEFVPNVTKVMNIWFIDDYTGTYDFCKFVACHASRQFGENQNMIDIEKNQDKHTYIATVGEVVYCYYYSAREGDEISVDTNYEYLLDFDDTPFIDNELFLTSL